WHTHPDLTAILKDDVHLLMTGGDNIGSLWQRCGAGNKDCITPYADLIDAYPDLFRSTPFMPVLGNHDREIRPRGDRPPAEPVYDVDATAFRHFAERVEVDGLLYFNTSLNGKGDKYPDPKSKAIFSEDNYVLLTFDRAKRKMAIELKSLGGKVMDRVEVVGK